MEPTHTRQITPSVSRYECPLNINSLIVSADGRGVRQEATGRVAEGRAIRHQAQRQRISPSEGAFRRVTNSALPLSRSFPGNHLKPNPSRGTGRREVRVLRMTTTDNVGYETFLVLLSLASSGEKSALTQGFWLGTWRDKSIISLPFRPCRRKGPRIGRCS